MNKTIFLGKIKDDSNRDCVKYMDFTGFECDHYFGGLHICGSCFSGGIEDIKNNIDNFETILTKEELLKLFELNDKIKALGSGIEKNSDKYNKGLEIIEEYENTIGKKLHSKENKKLFKKIIVEEKEKMKNEWNLSDEDIEKIFDEYSLPYRDSSIIAYVYQDFYELGENFSERFYYRIDKNIKKYIDFERLGEDIVEDNEYVILDDNRIVDLNY